MTHDAFPPTPLVGVDFSSRPTRRKPIAVAHGERSGDVVRLNHLETHATLAQLGDWLAKPGKWLGGFDFPFGLPRSLVEQLDWPTDWLPLMRHYAAMPRALISRTFAEFRAARPAGGKWAHRATDMPAGSSPSMRDVNPPVAYMMHAGVPLLIDCGAHIPGLHAGDPSRVALEAYPGMLAREILKRASYKSDEKAKQTNERRAARMQLIDALEKGKSRLGLLLALTPVQRAALTDDGCADRLDAVLCLMQAAWASTQPNYGLPETIDSLEGWIVSA